MKKVLALAVAGALTFAAPAWADREHSTNNTSKKLREAVTVGGILEHEAALAAHRDVHGRQPPLRHAGLRRVGALRGRAGRGRRPPGQPSEFDYDLDLLADFTPPVLSVMRAGRPARFVPGIGGHAVQRGRLRHDVRLAVR